MIQKGTYIQIGDNSGGRILKCLTLKRLYKFVRASFIIRGVIKKLRRKRRSYSKVTKGKLYNALIIKSKLPLRRLNYKTFYCDSNIAIILNNNKEPLSTRIFFGVPKEVRKKKKSKLIIISKFVY